MTFRGFNPEAEHDSDSVRKTGHLHKLDDVFSLAAAGNNLGEKHHVGQEKQQSPIPWAKNDTLHLESA